MALTFGSIIRLLINKSNRNDRFRNKMDMISLEMDQLALTPKLKNKITAYYDYLWMHNQTMLFGAESVYNDPDLSVTLKKEVTTEMVNGATTDGT